MSCAQTEQAVLDETKDVTRRLGWWCDRNGRRLLVPGDELTLVRKAMGRKPGEPLVRLAQVRVVSVKREPLRRITDDEVRREGVAREVCDWAYNAPDLGSLGEAFVAWYCETFKCGGDVDVTRIEWEYLHPTVLGGVGSPRGVCRQCYRPFEPGEVVRLWDDGTIRHEHHTPDHLRGVA